MYYNVYHTSTKCTVHPETRTPAAKTSSCACAPLNDGNNEGCTFIKAPRHRFTKLSDKIRMKPARQTISTPAALSSTVIAASNASRLG